MEGEPFVSRDSPKARAVVNFEQARRSYKSTSFDCQLIGSPCLFEVNNSSCLRRVTGLMKLLELLWCNRVAQHCRLKNKDPPI